MCSNKEKFEMYNALRDEAWNEFDKKAGFEWRMSFGIWAALGAATALCIQENDAFSKTELHQYITPAISAIIILHVLFLSWIQFTHRLNRDRQQFWSRKMAALAIPDVVDRMPEPRKALKWIRLLTGLLVAPIIQLFITIVLSAGLYVAAGK